jgi:hypothetical protein
MLETNDQVPDLEKLDREDFVINIDARDSQLAKNQEEASSCPSAQCLFSLFWTILYHCHERDCTIVMGVSFGKSQLMKCCISDDRLVSRACLTLGWGSRDRPTG